MHNLHVRPNFDLVGKKNKIYHGDHSLKERRRISIIAKFGWQML